MTEYKNEDIAPFLTRFFVSKPAPLYFEALLLDKKNSEMTVTSCKGVFKRYFGISSLLFYEKWGRMVKNYSS